MSRYNFCLKARLKTGMDFLSPVSKQTWKMTFFGPKYMLGQDLGIQVANPPPRIPRSTHSEILPQQG